MRDSHKRRRIRIEPPEEQYFESEGESWAVSYADFLMVLLSFFIIFFSYSKEKTQSIIDKIVIDASGTGSQGSGDGSGSGSGSGSGAGEGTGGGFAFSGAGFGGPDKEGKYDRKPAETLKRIISQGGFKIEEKEKQLVLHFPDKLFNPGGVDLPDSGRKLFFSVLTKLKPYLGELQITIIGHTDQSKIVRLRSKHLRNNFDLSVLRATRALN